MMGVSGIRGVVGQTMTPQLAADAACAFATHLGGRGTVVLGRDSRSSGPVIAAAVRAGLRACGCEVIDLGMVTTPATGLMVRELGARGGVVITASHNPAAWNGIKFLVGQGRAPFPDEAAAILDRLRRRDFEFAGQDAPGRLAYEDSANGRHVEAVLRIVDVDAIRRRPFRIVLDSVNGAGGSSGRMLLEALGCAVIHLNPDADGRFAHHPEPVAENLTDLCEAVVREDAALGFAQDPDADRLAIVDETGRYIGEEYTLAIAAQAVVCRGGSGIIVANLSTSRMIDDLAASAGPGWRVVRTPVGEANVVQGMIQHESLIGGEGNGGVIDPRVGWVRDSLVAMALVLEHLTFSSAAVSDVVSRLPRYRMIKTKEPCDPAAAGRALDRLRRSFAGERLNTSDGLRIDWAEGWAHLRASNTEPILRLIAEAADEASARALIERVQAAMSDEN